MGGLTHQSLALYNDATQSLIAGSSNAASLDTIFAMAPDGGQIRAGGAITNFGGARSNVISFGSGTGVGSSFSPMANNELRAIAVSGYTTYLGGFFTTVDGLAAANLAAVYEGPPLTATPTPFLSNTRSPSFTPSPQFSATNTPSVTPTPSISPTWSASPTLTPSLSVTPSFSASPTSSVSPTWSCTQTFSVTPSITQTWTVSPTPTPSPSFSASPTWTQTWTLQPTSALAPPRTGKVFSFPNPFRPGNGALCSIRFEPCNNAILELYDISARKVGEIQESKINSAQGIAYWDGRLAHGGMAAPGLYFLLLRSDSGTLNCKLTVIR
jgi:hypothetical protein